MPFLDDLSRKIRAQLPNWMDANRDSNLQQMLLGQAQLRSAGHPNAVVLPQDQYQSAVGAFGSGNEKGMTVNKDNTGLVSWLLSRGNATNRNIQSQAQQSPTVVLPQGFSHADAQHEAFHAGPYQSAANKMNPQDAMKLIPQEARDSMARYYKPSEMAGEIGANANSGDYKSMQLDSTGSGVNTGSDLRRNLIEMMRKIDPSRADLLAKQWGLAGPAKSDIAPAQPPAL